MSRCPYVTPVTSLRCEKESDHGGNHHPMATADVMRELSIVLKFLADGLLKDLRIERLMLWLAAKLDRWSRR